jgi:hypothetical protein
VGETTATSPASARLVEAPPGRGTPDEDVLEFARAQGRAIVTENISDFRLLAEAVLAFQVARLELIASPPRNE